jgi:hypothetical protein
VLFAAGALFLLGFGTKEDSTASPSLLFPSSASFSSKSPQPYRRYGSTTCFLSPSNLRSVRLLNGRTVKKNSSPMINLALILRSIAVIKNYLNIIITQLVKGMKALIVD